MVNDSDIRVLHINAPEMALIRLMARAAMRSMLLQALSGTQIQVYTFLQQNGEHTAQQIAGMLRMNKDTVKNALAALHEMQLVSNDNRAKGAKWKVQ